MSLSHEGSARYSPASPDRGREPVSSFPVPPQWYDAYKQGDRMFPQTTFGIAVLLGREVLTTIRDGEASWKDFRASQLTEEQRAEEVVTVIDFHRNFGIGVMPEGYQQGNERPFAHTRFQEVYQGGVDTVSRAVYELATSAQPPHERPTVLEETAVIETYLQDSANLDTALSLFSGAAAVFDTPEMRSAAAAHKARLNYKKLGTDSEPITAEQKSILSAAVVPTITDAVVSMGTEKGIADAGTTKFVKTITDLDTV